MLWIAIMYQYWTRQHDLCNIEVMAKCTALCSDALFYRFVLYLSHRVVPHCVVFCCILS